MGHCCWASCGNGTVDRHYNERYTFWGASIINRCLAVGSYPSCEKRTTGLNMGAEFSPDKYFDLGSDLGARMGSFIDGDIFVQKRGKSLH